MKTSVVIIGPAHPLRGGLSSFNERLARQFNQEGKEAEIYTFSLQYPGFLFPGSTQYSAEPKPTDLNIKVCINSINPLNWIRNGYRLKKQQPDIIVVRYWLPFMGPCLGTILRIAKRNNHTKVICIADNIIPHEKRPGDTWFTAYFLKPIDAFITMSAKVSADLKSLSNKKFLQVAHPLYDNFGEKLSSTEARKQLNISEEHQLVLFFGFIRKYKGLDLLFEAIAELKNKHAAEAQNIRFLIAGEFYENPQPYLDQIKALDIEKYLILKNEFIQDSEVKYYLSTADCIIQPYKSATQSGVTPLAYHFEKPMIVTNVGGLPDLVPSGIGFIAEPNAISLAEKILLFFKQDQSVFIQNIQLEKKKFGWDKITEAVVSLAHLK